MYYLIEGIAKLRDCRPGALPTVGWDKGATSFWFFWKALDGRETKLGKCATHNPFGGPFSHPAARRCESGQLSCQRAPDRQSGCPGFLSRLDCTFLQIRFLSFPYFPHRVMALSAGCLSVEVTSSVGEIYRTSVISLLPWRWVHKEKPLLRCFYS